MSYITMEIWTGIWILVRLLPMALIIFSGVMIIEVGIEFIQKKKIEVKILNWLCQFLWILICLLYTSPSPRDGLLSRMPSSA